MLIAQMTFAEALENGSVLLDALQHNQKLCCLSGLRLKKVSFWSRWYAGQEEHQNFVKAIIFFSLEMLAEKKNPTIVIQKRFFSTLNKTQCVTLRGLAAAILFSNRFVSSDQSTIDHLIYELAEEILLLSYPTPFDSMPIEGVPVTT